MNDDKHIYTLELTKRQAELLSYACDQFSRCIEGQDNAFQELMEAAWEKRCKKATGEEMDKNWGGGWSNMRRDAQNIANAIKARFWGLPYNVLNGIHYDDTADILFSIHTVIRHQLWLDRPEEKRSTVTVDSDEGYKIGSEPLAIIKRKEK